MKLPRITLKWMRKHDACWSDERLKKTFFDKQRSYSPQDFVLACLEEGLNYSCFAYWIVEKAVSGDGVDALFYGFDSKVLGMKQHSWTVSMQNGWTPQPYRHHYLVDALTMMEVTL